MIDVRLDWSECDFGGGVAIRRRVKAVAMGRELVYGADADEDKVWDYHVLGTLGEMAAAKALNLYWPAATRPDYEGDLGEGVHIRTAHRPGQSLILHDRDPDDGLFFLVVLVSFPLFRVVGGLIGAEGKQDRYWRESGVRHPAFFVPESALADPTSPHLRPPTGRGRFGPADPSANGPAPARPDLVAPAGSREPAGTEQSDRSTAPARPPQAGPGRGGRIL